MIAYVWPILLIIASNVCYNMAAKSTPQDVNPFASLLVTYLVSMAVTAVLFVMSSAGKGGVLIQFQQIRWSSIILGLILVGLEFGYIMAYRAGWQVRLGALVANSALAVILLIDVYKRQVSRFFA